MRASEIFPITPLVRQLQRLAIETFEISEEAALDYAAEQVSLADGCGGPGTAEKMDWPYRIKKDLGGGKKLKWRSEEERVKFETAQRQKYAAYDAFIRGGRLV